MAFNNPQEGGGATTQYGVWPLDSPHVFAGASLINSGSTAASSTTYSLGCHPIQIPYPGVTFKTVFLPIAYAANAGTGSLSAAILAGIYSLNGSTLSLMSSANLGVLASQNSATAFTYSIFTGTHSSASASSSAGDVRTHLTGSRYGLALTTGTAITLSQGEYFIVGGASYLTAGANIAGISNIMRGVLGTTMSHIPFGDTSNFELRGRFSSLYTTNSAHVVMPMPATIHSTRIDSNGANAAAALNHLYLK